MLQHVDLGASIVSFLQQEDVSLLQHDGFAAPAHVPRSASTSTSFFPKELRFDRRGSNSILFSVTSSMAPTSEAMAAHNLALPVSVKPSTITLTVIEKITFSMIFLVTRRPVSMASSIFSKFESSNVTSDVSMDKAAPSPMATPTLAPVHKKQHKFEGEKGLPVHSPNTEYTYMPVREHH